MADICILVEGAYPYVTGGVSSWIQSLLTNLPDITFAVMYIGSTPEQARKKLYTFPKNVVEFREVFISDITRANKKAVTSQPASAWQRFRTFHEAIALNKPYTIEQFVPDLLQPGFAGLTLSDIFYARESWELLTTLYEEYAPRVSFVDFFWTFRFTYLPIFSVLAAQLPDAQVYHAVSTGFTGLLGSLAKIRLNRPFIVTEHGLYTREREIEIVQSTWMREQAPSSDSEKRRMGFFQEWWYNMFRFMEKITYDTADMLISITGVNQQYQIQRGIPVEKLKIIPNGINVQQLANLRQTGAQESIGTDSTEQKTPPVQETSIPEKLADISQTSTAPQPAIKKTQFVPRGFNIEQLIQFSRQRTMETTPAPTSLKTYSTSPFAPKGSISLHDLTDLPAGGSSTLRHSSRPATQKLPRKVQFIRGGLHLEESNPPSSKVPASTTTRPFLVGFVGRVVPIKDVKTFIRALKIASATIPNLQAYLVGPTEEDQAYFEECQHLVTMLELEDILHFTGSADVKKYYSQLDVLVLTSLSEGQPLVILEGNCAGVPVVATNVGSCRELLTGITPEDQELGPSGLITPVASPDATAQAIIQLWQDEELRLRMGKAGQERTKRYYRQEDLYQAYHDLYHSYMGRKAS